MNWLPATVIPRRQWPAIRFKDKRAITLAEHQKIVAAEVNPERRTLYQLCWHLGASQGDIAALKGEDVDWANNTISFFRKKTGVPVLVHLGSDALNLLTRSSTGVATTLAGQSTDLSAAYAAQVRLTQLCYLKLERSRNLFTASLSPDGRAWSVVATAKLSFQTKLLAGLSASSCRAKVTTTVRFDHVTVVPKNARELK